MIRAAAVACLLALPAAAQEVADCDWQAAAGNIAEPWEDNSRSFANGAVRLALLDTVEPGSGWAWLLILSPPFDELGSRQCRVVGAAGMGFSGMDFGALEAGYDPATGLVFTLPVQVPDGTDLAPRTLRVTLNQASGVIVAQVLR